MDSQEIRLKLIEIAARSPMPHPLGYVAGVVEAATAWEKFVNFSTAGEEQRRKLGLPKK
jgi:hypothetical protein